MNKITVEASKLRQILNNSLLVTGGSYSNSYIQIRKGLNKFAAICIQSEGYTLTFKIPDSEVSEDSELLSFPVSIADLLSIIPFSGSHEIEVVTPYLRLGEKNVKLYDDSDFQLGEFTDNYAFKLGEDFCNRLPDFCSVVRDFLGLGELHLCVRGDWLYLYYYSSAGIAFIKNKVEGFNNFDIHLDTAILSFIENSKYITIDYLLGYGVWISDSISYSLKKIIEEEERVGAECTGYLRLILGYKNEVAIPEILNSYASLDSKFYLCALGNSAFTVYSLNNLTSGLQVSPSVKEEYSTSIYYSGPSIVFGVNREVLSFICKQEKLHLSKYSFSPIVTEKNGIFTYISTSVFNPEDSIILSELKNFERIPAKVFRAESFLSNFALIKDVQDFEYSISLPDNRKELDMFFCPMADGKLRYLGGVSKEELSCYFIEFGYQRNFDLPFIIEFYSSSLFPGISIYIKDDTSSTGWVDINNYTGGTVKKNLTVQRKKRPQFNKLVKIDTESNVLVKETGEMDLLSPETDYLLIDGNYFIARAVNGKAYKILKQPITDKDSGAIFSFLQLLNKNISAFMSRNPVVCWDGGHAKWRTELYPDYKNRGTMPEGIKDSIKWQAGKTSELLACLGIPSLRYPGMEADDIIAYLAQSFNSKKVVILSGDSDYHQLVGGTVGFYNYKTSRYYRTAQEGIWSLWKKAIACDPSDNIKGVKDVGEGTVDKLFETLRTKGITELTLDIIQEVSKTHIDFRVQKIATPEARSIIERNLQLIDLRQGIQKIPIDTMINAVQLVHTPIERNKDKFMELVADLGLMKIEYDFSKMFDFIKPEGE